MFNPPEMMPDEQYEAEYKSGKHQTEYNRCRFAEDKKQYCKDWLKKNVPWADFENPKNMVDRICHYKVYDRDHNKIIWADKYNADFCLKWLAELEHIKIPTVYKNKTWITPTIWEYEIKPLLHEGEKYILKMTHGSGWNIIFTYDKNFNPDYLMQKTWEWGHLNYAYMTGYEWQYEEIDCGYVIQPYLGELLNWEFWCEKGEIKGVNLVKKFGKNLEQNVAWVDENGKFSKFWIEPCEMKMLNKSQMVILEKMKPIVKKLAKDFNFVRVDLYSVNGEVKFSELTFTPSSGRLRFLGSY